MEEQSLFGFLWRDGKLYKVTGWKDNQATYRELTEEEVMELYEQVQKFLNKDFSEESTDAK